MEKMITNCNVFGNVRKLLLMNGFLFLLNAFFSSVVSDEILLCIFSYRTDNRLVRLWRARFQCVVSKLTWYKMIHTLGICDQLFGNETTCDEAALCSIKNVSHNDRLLEENVVNHLLFLNHALRVSTK